MEESVWPRRYRCVSRHQLVHIRLTLDDLAEDATAMSTYTIIWVLSAVIRAYLSSRWFAILVDCRRRKRDKVKSGGAGSSCELRALRNDFDQVSGVLIA